MSAAGPIREGVLGQSVEPGRARRADVRVLGVSCVVEEMVLCARLVTRRAAA